MKRPFNKQSLEEIVKKLWTKCNDLEREAMHCRKHKYDIEAQMFDKQAAVLKEAIFTIETMLD